MPESTPIDQLLGTVALGLLGLGLLCDLASAAFHVQRLATRRHSSSLPFVGWVLYAMGALLLPEARLEVLSWPGKGVLPGRTGLMVSLTLVHLVLNAPDFFAYVRIALTGRRDTERIDPPVTRR